MTLQSSSKAIHFQPLPPQTNLKEPQHNSIKKKNEYQKLIIKKNQKLHS